MKTFRSLALLVCVVASLTSFRAQAQPTIPFTEFTYLFMTNSTAAEARAYLGVVSGSGSTNMVDSGTNVLAQGNITASNLTASATVTISNVVVAPSTYTGTLLDDTTSAAWRSDLGISDLPFLITSVTNVAAIGGMTVDNMVVTNDLTLYHRFAEQGVISPPQITGDEDNYAPTGIDTCSVMRLTTDNSTRKLTGLKAGTSGDEVMIMNVGSFSLILSNEDGNSAASNRFSLNTSLVLLSKHAVRLWYDQTSLRWRALKSLPQNLGTADNVTFNSVTTTAGVTSAGRTNTTGVEKINGITYTWPTAINASFFGWGSVDSAGNLSWLSERVLFKAFDDFVGANTGTSTAGEQWGTTLSTGTAANVASEAGHLGLLQLSSGGTSGNYASLSIYNGVANGFLIQTNLDSFWMVALVRLNTASSSSDNATFKFGLIDAIATTGRGIWWQQNVETNAAFQAIGFDGTTPETYTHGVAYTTGTTGWVWLGIKYNAANSVDLYYSTDGATLPLVGTLTASRGPGANAMRPFCGIVKAKSTTAMTCTVDFVGMYYKVGTYR